MEIVGCGFGGGKVGGILAGWTAAHNARVGFFGVEDDVRNALARMVVEGVADWGWKVWLVWWGVCIYGIYMFLVLLGFLIMEGYLQSF